MCTWHITLACRSYSCCEQVTFALASSACRKTSTNLRFRENPNEGSECQSFEASSTQSWAWNYFFHDHQEQNHCSIAPCSKVQRGRFQKTKKKPAENVCLEAINKKLSNIEAICQDIQKKDAGKISRLQKEAAKINIQWKDCAAENKNLKLQVLQLNSVQIDTFTL